MGTPSDTDFGSGFGAYHSHDRIRHRGEHSYALKRQSMKRNLPKLFVIYIFTWDSLITLFLAKYVFCMIWIIGRRRSDGIACE